MASFTDNIQSLTNFTPYRQQQPIELMTKVGMAKQEQYNQGIQKIQSSIDSIAGLDIAKDSERAYLQSKMNELGNNLKFVAAGDFSDFSLVNSVNGMTTSLVKDDVIQTAVASTAKLRKGYKNMEEAIKAGKSSASNEWLFKTSANEYLQDAEIGKSFNSDFKSYTNYSKNAIEVIKGLVKNSTTKDVSLQFDSKGNVVGILDATTRTKIEGITPERIQQALLAGLTPDDFNQMQIDGRYNYSNVSGEKFTADIKSSFEKNSEKYNKQKEFLVNSMTTTTSILEKQKLKDQIDSLDRTINNLSTEYNNTLSSISNGNIESAKAKLFTNDWINNFSQTFSNQDISQTDETNPYQQVKQYRETKALEWKKYTLDYEQKERFEKNSNYYKDEDLKIKRAAAKKEEDSQYGAVPFTVDQSTLPDITLSKIISEVKLDESNLVKGDNDIMKEFGKEGNKGWLDTQLLAWQKSPSSVDPRLSKYFNKTEPLKRDLFTRKQLVLNIEKEADSEYGKIYDKIPQGSPSIRVKFPSGSYVYSPKEMVDFNEKFKSYVNYYSGGGAYGGGGGGGVTYNDKLAKEELSSKEYFLYESMKNPKTETQKTLNSRAKEYNKLVNIPFGKVIKEKEKFVEDTIKERTMAMQGVSYQLPVENFGTVLQQFADRADTQKGGMANSPGLDTSLLRTIAPDLKNANIRIVEGTKYVPASYEVTAGDSKGNTQTFKIDEETYNSVFKGKFNADSRILAARPYLNQMIMMKSNTTSLDGLPTNINNSFAGNIDFPNIKLYGVSANVVGNRTDGFSIRINIIDPTTKKIIVEDQPYPRKTLIEENQIAQAMQGLTDAEIFSMIYGRNPTAKDIQTLEKESQKPY